MGGPFHDHESIITSLALAVHPVVMEVDGGVVVVPDTEAQRPDMEAAIVALGSATTADGAAVKADGRLDPASISAPLMAIPPSSQKEIESLLPVEY